MADDLLDFLNNPLVQGEQDEGTLGKDIEDLRFLDSLVQPPSQKDDDGEFVRGVKRGVHQTKALGKAAGAAYTRALGFDKASESLVEGYMESSEAAEALAPKIGNIENINSVEDFTNWAAGMLGEQVPVIATIVGTGGIAGVLGRMVAKRVLTKTAADQVAKQASAWGARSATAGVVSASSGLETGGQYGEQIDIGVRDPGVAIVGGTMAGTLEALTPLALMRRFGIKLPIAQGMSQKIENVLTEKGLLARMGLSSLAIAGTEATTEGIQEAIAIAARSYVDENYDSLGAEAASRILNSVASGALVGGVFGAAAGVRKGERASQPEDLPVETPDEIQVEPAPPVPITEVVNPGVPEVVPPVQTAQADTPTKVNYGLSQPILLFEGDRVTQIDPNAAEAREVMITEALVPPENRTPAQQVLMQREQARRAKVFQDFFELPKQPSVKLQALLDARGNALKLDTNRVSDTGELTPAAKEQVKAINTRINAVAEAEGIEIPSYDKLSEKENLRYAYLLEKDITEGPLTSKEYGELERLQAKAEGEKQAERQAPDARVLEELEQSIEEGLDRDAPLYSQPALQRKKLGITQEELQTELAPIWIEGVPVEVYDTPLDIPDKNLRDIFVQRMTKTGRSFEGAFVPHLNKSYLFLNGLSRERAAKVYLHEVIAHYGMRQVFPPEVLGQIRQVIRKSRPETISNYLSARNLEKTEQNELQAAEEYIAKIAEDGTDMPLLRKVIALIRRWLREVFPNMKITDDEIRLMLQRVQKDLTSRVIDNNPASYNNPEPYFSDEESGGPQYTMRIMRQVPKKDWVTRAQVEQGLKAIQANKAEKQIVMAVLDKPFMGDRFLRATFEHELRQMVTPLFMHESVRFAEYGLANIKRTATRRTKAMTHVWAVPFKTPEDLNHFHANDYAGHTRVFAPSDSYVFIESEDGNYYVLEVQSDLVQRLGNNLGRPQTVEAPTTAIEGLQALHQEYAHQLARLNDLTGPLRSPTFGWWTPERRSGAVQVYKDYIGNPRSEDPDVINNLMSKEDDFVNTMLDALKDQIEVDLEETRLLLELARHKRFNEPVEIETQQRWENLAPTLFKRMVREELKYASKHYDRLRISSIYTLAVAEGWMESVEVETQRLNALENTFVQHMDTPQTDEESGVRERIRDLSVLNDREDDALGREYLKRLKERPRFKAIAERHEELLKWVQKEYKAKFVKDQFGFGWYEISLTREMAEEPVLAYYSDAADAAMKLQNALGIQGNKLPDSLEKFNNLWGTKALVRMLTPIQISQQYQLPPIKDYVARVDSFAATKGQVIEPATMLIERWLKLPKDKSNALARAIFEVAAKSDEEKRKLTPDEVAAILRQYKISGEALEVFKEQEATFGNLLNRLESGLKYMATRESLENPEAASEFIRRWEETKDNKEARGKLLSDIATDKRFTVSLIPRLNEIEKDIAKLRNRNYFPYMRFGQYTITVKAKKDGMKYKGETFDAGELVQFFTFESTPAQESFFKSPEIESLRRQGFAVAMSQMEDTQFTFYGLPPSLMDSMKNSLELTDAQQEELKEIFIRHSPGRAFLRHLIQRKGIEGFSQDAMRVYATYMMNAANHIARLEHYVDMDRALANLKNLRFAFDETSEDSRTLMEIYNALQRHKHYLLNPGNELASLRALGFMWYLGFSVKSAAVNFTQTPMVTYPYLASRYGDGAAFSALAGAIKDAGRFIVGKAAPDPVLDRLMARGVKEAFLDASLATELAGIAEGTTLQRVMPVDKAHRLLNQFSFYGSWPFRQAEKFTRSIAFIAAVRLEMQKGADEEIAYQAGKEAVRTTLFEYAKWNRPEFMRGKKSVFFLFWLYMQHMSYLAFGGAGAGTAMRIWIMMMLMGGLQGLPYMENLLDLLDFGIEKIKKALGLQNPYTDLRTDMHELLTQMTDQPDLIMHGMSRYWGLGPVHLLNLIGAPIPRVDTSGSISMGRVIPGIDQLLGPSKSPDEKFGRTIVEVMGPVFGMPYALWKSMTDTDPDSWKRWERAMPSALKAASKATRWITRGEEEFRAGGTVAEFDPHNMEHRVEELAQMFGFTSTRVAQRYEVRSAQEQIKEYYITRRAMLLDDYAYVVFHRDPEGIADIRKEIKAFNSSVPNAKLRIGTDTLNRSINQRRKLSALREQGQSAQKMLRPLYQDVSEAYPETDLPR